MESMPLEGSIISVDGNDVIHLRPDAGALTWVHQKDAEDA
jgi:hypothetical protein